MRRQKPESRQEEFLVEDINNVMRNIRRKNKNETNTTQKQAAEVPLKKK